MIFNRRVIYRFLAAGLLAVSVGAAVATDAAAVNSPEDEARIRAFIIRGKEFYRIKDFQSAIKSWVKVLNIDPLHEEAMELIDDAKFQSDYQVAVLDKLEQDRRLKKPYADELSKMANEMNVLLKRAEEQRGSKKSNNLSSVPKEEALRHVAEQNVLIQETFDRGLRLFLAGMKREAYVEWDKILPSLPKEHDLAVRIKKLKQDADTIQQPMPPSSEPTAPVHTSVMPPNAADSRIKPAIPFNKSEAVGGVRMPARQVNREALTPRESVPSAETSARTPSEKQAPERPAEKPMPAPSASPNSASMPVQASPSPSAASKNAGRIWLWALIMTLIGLAFAAAFWIGAHGSYGRQLAAAKRIAHPKRAPMRSDTPPDQGKFDPKALSSLLKSQNREERDLLEP